MKKVIYVPGFIGKPKDTRVIKPALVNFEFIYFDYDTSLKEPLDKIARKLKRFINNLKLGECEKIDIIGFSAGGVISDYYLKFLDKTKVEKFVSIHSPFKGTYLASLSKTRKGLQQLKPKSSFLNKLSKKKLTCIKTKNIYSKFDPIVPGDSGGGVNSKSHSFFIHPYAMLWKPVVREVKKFLEE